MSWFGKGSEGSDAEFGVCNGSKVGHLGVWGRWSEGSGETAVYQIRLEAKSSDGSQRVSTWTYTPCPAPERSFYISLEMPREFKEFLVGQDRAPRGEVTVEFIRSGGGQGSVKQHFDLAKFLRVYRCKGPGVPDRVEYWERYLEPEFGAQSLADLTQDDLKARNEKVKAEIEAEQKRRDEEARKAKEEADKKAAEAASKKAGASSAGAAPGGPTISGGRCAIFYGSTTNNTADVAAMIKEELGDSVNHVVNVAECSPEDFKVCEVMLLGVPTWHIGEMQDDWALVLPKIKEFDYSGKKVACFGLGDQKGYPDTYVDAIGELVQVFEAKGATLHGFWPTEGYNFKASKGTRNGKFMGLVIDIENQSDQTPDRVKGWCAQIRSELGL